MRKLFNMKVDNQITIETNSEIYNEENIPEEFRCPISLDLMKEPVIAADGHSYDKTQINRWFQTNNTSPKTRDALLCKNLFPNLELRNRINDWLVENGKDPLLPYDPNPSNNIQRTNISIENMRSNVNDIINRTIDVLEENDIDSAINEIQDERFDTSYNNRYIIQRYWRSLNNMRPDGGSILNSSDTNDREDLRRYGLRSDYTNSRVGPENGIFPGPRINHVSHQPSIEQELSSEVRAEIRVLMELYVRDPTIGEAIRQYMSDPSNSFNGQDSLSELIANQNTNNVEENGQRNYPELTEEEHFDNQFDEWWRSQRFQRGWASPRILCNSCGRVNILRFGCRFCNAPLRLSNRERTANNIQHLYSSLMQLGVQIGNDVQPGDSNSSQIMNVQNEIRVLNEEIRNINSELEAVRALAALRSSST